MQPAWVAVRAQQEIPQEVIVSLDMGSALIGMVLDPYGMPIQGASVNVVGLQSLDWTFTTDANGTFETDGLNPTVAGYLIHIVHPAYPSLMTRIQPAMAGQTATRTFVLEPGVILFGQVTDPDGRPVPGVTVGNTISGRMWNCVEARTNENGVYELGRVHTGDHVLWATHERYAPFVGRTQLRQDETQHRVDIQLGTGRILRGRVVDDQGQPVPQAVVRIDSYETVYDLVETDHVCDANGCFTISNAPDYGTLRLSVRGSHIVRIRHEVDFTQDECLISSPRIGRIYGRVLDALTGQPIPHFTVWMDFSRSAPCSAGFRASWSEEGHVFDSPEGLFDTGGEELPIGGTLLLTVCAEGYDPVTIDPVVVVPIGEQPRRTEFRLPPATVPDRSYCHHQRSTDQGSLDTVLHGRQPWGPRPPVKCSDGRSRRVCRLRARSRRIPVRFH